MARDLPYLVSYKNVSKLFDSIYSAKQPDTFTHQFLHNTLGMSSSGDRSFIPLLKALGFLDSSNRPTPAYGMLKNPATKAGAISAAVRKAYAPLFEANEKANEAPNEQLKGLVAQVAGTDESMTTKVVGTFNALKALGDWNAAPDSTPKDQETEEEDVADEEPPREQPQRKSKGGGFEPQFHYNIQVQLPANGTEETYLNIFSALRKVFPS